MFGFQCVNRKIVLGDDWQLNIYLDDQWQKISMNLVALDMNRRQQIRINKDITLTLLLSMHGIQG